MASNAGRGAYYKGRTKKWLIAQGWQVADLEVTRWIHPPGRSALPIKRDQLGSDLLAVSAHRIAFVQVKSGAQAAGDTQFPDAQREFHRFTFPPFVRLLIAAWTPGARFPRLIVVNPKEITDAQEATTETGRPRTTAAHTPGQAGRKSRAREGAATAAARADRRRPYRGARQDRLPLR
jgi:hypothetical protein